MKTRNSLFTSVIALVLCVAMLAGTTYAWFTDVATSKDNVIQTGNLDVTMEWANDFDATTWQDATTGAIFTHNNWEPGYTDVKYIKITNKGNLNLKWRLTLEAEGAVTKLSDVIDVYCVNPATAQLTSIDGLTSAGTLTNVLNNTDVFAPTGALVPGAEVIVAMAMHMDEDAGNTYQGLSLCNAGFSVKIVATQDVGESDSFGDQYDNNAEWPEFKMDFEATTSLEGISTIYGELATDITIRHESGAYAIVPAGTKLADGATELKFTGKNVDSNGNFADAARSYDIHISGIADDNNQCITVFLGKILEPGLAETGLKLYHESALMTRVNSESDFATPDQYTYNAETGAVTIYVKNFSVFSAVQTSADTWDGTSDTIWYNESDTEFTLTTAEQFAGFRDLVDGGNTFAGKTVKLDADIDLDNKSFDPIGFGYYNAETNTRVFMGTFDGENHTIYNLYENCWELDPDKTNYSTYTYSTAGAGLFASIKDATIKNLAISGAEIVFECVDMGVLVGYAQGTCHFENIVVTNANIANYNRYTGGLVGEVSYGPYGIDTTLGYSHTFKNITIDSSVTVSGLWGSFGCGMGGVIGGKWGDATVKMENVISAPVMDVYNDVVSAYQWYAFRGCGMLIGHTEEPYSDGRHSGNATASFLTCENVMVYYGDWVNYHYYEFENQDNATGQRYPWVRAEAGEYCDAFSNIRYGVPTHNGEKVSDLSEEELKEIATDYTPIVFDQLYGADRGMYGTANHEGVTVFKKNVKTIYVENNLDWTDLKLDYWYKHSEDTWTNLLESIALTPIKDGSDVYKLEIPYYADSFKITSAESAEGKTFELSSFADGEHISIDGEHIHAFVNQKCVCGAFLKFNEYEFTLGENGEAKHNDGGNAVTTYEENGYTLTLEGLGSVYGNARDELGNSCIKLGTSSLVGKFSFTVPEDIVKVIIYVAGYKYNNATVIVNDVRCEITTLSNNGEYTAVEVDTSETKTVSFTTVDANGESRCMINTISFATSEIIEVHDCDENAELPAVEPNCTETGLTAGKACSVCGKVMVEQETVPATGHTEETIPAVDATCTKNGLTEGTWCSVCEEILVAQQTIPSTGHNYVEGTCSNCGEAFPTTSGTYTYVFSEYTEGTQYAKGEEHELDKYVTITTYDCHFTSELRIYSSNTNNGYAIVYSVNPITTIGVNAGNKVDTLNIYGSNDGVNWTTEPVTTISVTSTSYKDYEASLGGEYKYLKIDVAGSNQVRLASMTLTTVPDCAHASTTEKVVAPTCTEAGRTDTVCSSCGKVMSTVAGDPATGHSYSSEITQAATCTEAGEKTYTCAKCGDTYTEVIAATGHTTDNGVCGNCGETIGEETTTQPNPDPETPTETGWVKVEDLTDIESEDVIVIVWTKGNTSWAISNDKGTGSAPTAVVVTVSGNKLDGIIAENIKWNIVNDNGNLTIHPNGTTETWLYCTSTNNGVRVGTNANKVFTIDATSGYLKNTATSRYVGVYTTNPDIRCYTSTGTNISDQTLAFYKLVGGNEGGETPSCEHNYEEAITQAATCTEPGVKTYTCAKCNDTYTEEIVALGHTTDNGVCGNCGQTIGGSTESTTSMDIHANQGSLSNKVITWTNGNVTFSNAQASSTTAIRTSDSDHFRVYAKSIVTIEAKGKKITQVVITCTSGDYANVMKTSAENSGYTATVSGSVVTITVNNAESITFTASAQTRLNEVEVTYTA